MNNIKSLIDQHYPMPEGVEPYNAGKNPLDFSGSAQEQLHGAMYQAQEDEESMQEIYNKFSSEVRQTQKSLTEEELLNDKNFIEAAKVFYYNKNPMARHEEVDDAEISKWGLNYISDTAYNLSYLGATAYSIDDFSQSERIAMAYMLDTLEDKEVTWSGAGRALRAMGKDPTTYMGVGALVKVIKNKPISMFKSRLSQAIATSAFEGGAYASAEEAMMQEIEEEAWGTEKDPLTVALHGLLGAGLGAALPLAAPAAVGLAKGAKKMIGEAIDTPMGDMLTGTMRMQEAGKVPKVDLSGYDEQMRKHTESFREKATNVPELQKITNQYTSSKKYKKPTKLYRGVSTDDEFSGGGTEEGIGLYTTANKTLAKQYGDVKEMDVNLDLPDNPLIFDDHNQFQIWMQQVVKETYGKMPRKSEYSGLSINEIIDALGLPNDGIQIGHGNKAFWVKFPDINELRKEGLR